MKRRVPGTLPHVIQQMMVLIGVDGCADAAGLKPSIIYKWSDPDDAAKPCHEQLYLLDRACMEVAGRAPFCEFYTRRLGDATTAPPTLERAVLNLGAAVGHVTERAVEAMREDSDAGIALSAAEKHVVLEAIAAAYAKMALVEKAVQHG